MKTKHSVITRNTTRLPGSLPCRAAAALGVLLALATSLQAAITVAPGGSIQQALDLADATPGPDTVILRAGEYHENLLIEDAGPVKLLGIGQVTIVSTDPGAHVILAIGGEVTIQNVTVTGGDDGINASGCESLSLIKVDALCNGDEGVDAEFVLNFSVISSRIMNNGDHGLQIEGTAETQVKILHGFIATNGGDGIKVAVAAGVEVTSSLCIGNDDGMDLDDVGSIKVRSTLSFGNNDEGMEVDGAGSVQIIASSFQGNTGEGIDTDDVSEIALVAVACRDNGGSGFQTVAESVNTGTISIISSLFSDNGVDGVQLLERSGTIAAVKMNGVVTRDNIKSGLNILISGTLIRHSVTSENNGTPDVLP